MGPKHTKCRGRKDEARQKGRPTVALVDPSRGQGPGALPVLAFPSLQAGVCLVLEWPGSWIRPMEATD